MFVFTLYFGLKTTLAFEPSHLKPGALTAHMGRVTLVEDTLWIRYPYTALKEVPSSLRQTMDKLGEITTKLERGLPAGFKSSKDYLSLVQTRITYLNESIQTALENYLLVNTTERVKRGLINGVGQISRWLFGTAMNEDVDKLKENFNKLSEMALEQNKVINLNCWNIAKLEQHVHDLADYSDNLRLTLNDVLAEIDGMYSLAVVNQLLPVLENTVNSLTQTNKLIVENIVDAARGRVTSSLFPVRDFLHVLEIAETTYKLQPLFDFRGLHHYYPLLESVLTTDAMVIHVPFQSPDNFEIHQIEPFPFAVNDTVMVLDLPSSVVLISTDYSLYAIGHLMDLQRCKSEYLSLYHCPASLFAFLPLTGKVCEVTLSQKNASKALSLCPFKQLAPKPLFHRSFLSHHYFFFTKPIFVSVVCPDGTVYKEVSGHLAVLLSCKLRSANLTTFPSKLHEGFTSNLTAKVFSLDGLKNINISSVKYVTNSLSEFTFSNHSDFKAVLQESLPAHLNPYAHASYVLGPIILTMIVIIPLFCAVRKALKLFMLLKGRVPPVPA